MEANGGTGNFEVISKPRHENVDVNDEGLVQEQGSG